MEREDAMESGEGRPLIPLVINSLGSFFFFPGISEGGFIVFLLTAEVFWLILSFFALNQVQTGLCGTF